MAQFCQIVSKYKGRRSLNMKQKTYEICINFSQNTNEQRYSEQLYRLGMLMF